MKYIDADLLRKEIERRRLQNRYIDTDGYEQELFEIINSLQHGQSSEDLEKEIDRLWESFSEEMSGPHNLFDVYRRLAHHFANWQKEQMMKDSMGIVRARITRDKMGQVIFELPDNSDSCEFILLSNTKNLPDPKCGSSANVKLVIIKED